TADLIYPNNINEAGLRPSSVASSRLQQLEDDVLHILANVASLSQGGRVHDREGHIEHPRQGLCEQRLARAGRPDQHDVRFGQFDTVAIALAVHIDPLVMVVDGYRLLLLGLLLTDYVFVMKYLV